MSSQEDGRLREHFAKLREEDRNDVPAFGRIAAAAPAISGRGSFRLALAALPVLAIAVMLGLRTHRSIEAVSRELTAWSSPTAFLLETPGQQLLNQTPRLGGPLLRALPITQDGPK